MRKGIDYIGVGAGAIIQDEAGRYFLTKRGKKARNEAGLWEFPGGGVEFGDTLEETVIREFKEEFGADIEVIKLHSIVNHLIPAEKQHWVAVGFICKLIKGAPRILEPEKCEEIGWFRAKDVIKLPLSPASRQHFEKLFSKST